MAYQHQIESLPDEDARKAFIDELYAVPAATPRRRSVIGPGLAQWMGAGLTGGQLA